MLKIALASTVEAYVADAISVVKPPLDCGHLKLHHHFYNHSIVPIVQHE